MNQQAGGGAPGGRVKNLHREDYYCFKCGGRMSLDLKGKYFRCSCGERCPVHLIKPGLPEEQVD